MRTHIVQKGDTLWKIAKQYGIGFEELKRLNSHLANPDYIVPGMEIILPDDGTGTKQTTGKEKVMPDKAKTIDMPPKAKPVETPPKAKEMPKKEMPKPEKPTPPQPAPQIVPIPQPMPQPMPIRIQQLFPMPEFHLDFSPQFSFQPQAQPMPQPAPQVVPMPQPMPQPIFIEVPMQPAPQPEKEEKEKVVEKEIEYVPVPQTHVEYVSVPQPIYIPCMPHHEYPCYPKHQMQKPCGCGGDVQQYSMQEYPTQVSPQMMPQWMDCYPPMMPYGNVQSAQDYSQMMPQYDMPGDYDDSYMMPMQDLQTGKQEEVKQGELPDWLFDSTSMDPVSKKDHMKEEHKKDVAETHMDCYPFEQATDASHGYYQMPQGYNLPMDQSMYQQPMSQQMHPFMHHGFEPYMHQHSMRPMNPCVPHFRPWSY